MKLSKPHFKAIGTDAVKFFKDAVKNTKHAKYNITSSKDLETLGESQAGREMLKSFLDYTKSHWEKQWGPSFLKNVMEDLGGSSFRMLAGSMAFNYEVVFDDNIPLEDKIFNVLVGAYMTKQGREVKYTAKDGTIKTMVAAPETVGHGYKQAGEYLGLLGIQPKDFTFQALQKDYQLRSEFFKNAADSPDVKKVI